MLRHRWASLVQECINAAYFANPYPNRSVSVFQPLPVEDAPPDIPEAMRAVRCVISCKARRETSGD